jgi:ABC-type glycerol-3-phosphate transport system substrate-binding protein
MPRTDEIDDTPVTQATNLSRTLTRRAIVAVSAAFAVPTIVRAQEQERSTELRLLFGTSAAPGGDAFTTTLVTSWGEANGVTIDCAFAPLSELPARVDRVLNGGEQRDIVELQDLQPFRQRDNLEDISDLAAAVIVEQGEYASWATQTVRVRNAWYSLPIGGATPAIIYRPGSLEALGLGDPAASFPADWQGWFDLAAELKGSLALPAGLALRQTPFAAPAFCYAYMWANGGAELSPGSRQVSFNSSELAVALSDFATAWTAGFDPAGTAWDDRDLLGALIERRVGMVVGGADIYLAAKSIGDADVSVAPIPSGPAGQFVPLGSRSLGIARRSRARDTARDFLAWWHAQAQYSQWVIAHQGAIIPPTAGLMSAPIFRQDGNMRPFVDALDAGRVKGFSAAPSQASAEVTANYFVVNTFTDVARGVDVPTALDRGQRLIERFFTQAR